MTCDHISMKACLQSGALTRKHLWAANRKNSPRDAVSEQSAHEMTESARRRDVLEAKLESIRAGLSALEQMGGTGALEHHYRACHALWELSSDVVNHRCMPPPPPPRASRAHRARIARASCERWSRAAV